jgi:hypothetical protein
VSNHYLNALKCVNARKQHRNLSHQELAAIKSLRARELMILPSDKGGDFCVSNKNDHEDAVFRHLNAATHYRPLSYVDPARVEDSINGSWRIVCKRRFLAKHIESHYVSQCTSIPTRKGLIKTHKNEANMVIRPIVNGTDGAHYKLTWLLQKILQKYAMQSHNSGKSCDEFILRLRNLDSKTLETYCYPFSLDVCDMYTSIPSSDAIDTLCDRLCEDNFTYHGILPVDIRFLLQTIFNNSFVRFGNKFYKQMRGLPMGNKLSGILADVFMSKLEAPLLRHLSIPFYLRYVDDSLILARDEPEADRVLAAFNNAHPSIQFQIEKPVNDNSLSLLDFTVLIQEGVAAIQPFTKRARSDMMMNGQTALPEKAKNNIVINEWQRIMKRCDNSRQIATQKRTFKEKLQRNGFCNLPNLRLNSPHPRVTNEPSQPFYLSIPFVSEELNTKIKKALKPLNLPIRIVHKGRQLQHILAKQGKRPPTRTGKCDLRGCALKNDSCFVKMVVYKVECTKCKLFYIGSTKKYLHTRIKEHNSMKSSSVHQHHATCQGGWTIHVLQVCKSLPDLRFTEALLIKDLQPGLNKKEEFFSISRISLI